MARYFEQIIKTYAPAQAAMPVSMDHGEQAAPEIMPSQTVAPIDDNQVSIPDVQFETPLAQDKPVPPSTPELSAEPTQTLDPVSPTITALDTPSQKVAQNVTEVIEQHDYFHIDEHTTHNTTPEITQNIEGDTTIAHMHEGDTHHHQYETTENYVTQLDTPAPMDTTSSDPLPHNTNKGDAAVTLLEERLESALAQMAQTSDIASIIQDTDFEPEAQDMPPPSAPETIREVTREVTREVHHHHETTVQSTPESPRPVTAATASQIGPIQFTSPLWSSSERY